MWVARDKNGDLWFFIDKPTRSKSQTKWELDNDSINSFLKLLPPKMQDDVCVKINSDLFPNLKWENEPIEI